MDDAKIVQLAFLLIRDAFSSVDTGILTVFPISPPGWE